MKIKFRGPRYETILRLSRPNTRYGRGYEPPSYDFPIAFKCLPLERYKVPRKLRKICSIGIPKLSQPRVVFAKYVRPKEAAPPYPPVSPLALRYKATKQLLRIAQPKKKYEDPNVKTNPYEVSKNSQKRLPPRLRRYYSRLATPHHSVVRKNPIPKVPTTTPVVKEELKMCTNLKISPQNTK